MKSVFSMRLKVEAISSLTCSCQCIVTGRTKMERSIVVIAIVAAAAMR
jgi:hypothetical protein